MGTQTAVATEDILLDDRRQWQAVVAIYKSAPQLHRVSPFALVIESVEVIYTGALVVSS